MMPPHSCAVPGRKPGTSTNVTSGMLNASQVRTQRAAFSRGCGAGPAGGGGGLVADAPDVLAPEPCEAADDVVGEERLDLEELAVVDDRRDHRLDVVRLRRLVRDQGVELWALSVDGIGGRVVRGRLGVVLRQEAQEVAR